MPVHIYSQRHTLHSHIRINKGFDSSNSSSQIQQVLHKSTFDSEKTKQEEEEEEEEMHITAVIDSAAVIVYSTVYYPVTVLVWVLFGMKQQQLT